MNVLRYFNRQKTQEIDTRFLKKITQHLLTEVLQEQTYELGVHLVDPLEMTRINWDFLRHKGSTDVITFDNRESAQDGHLNGELFISINDAMEFARQFRTNWQSETVRYVVHGILHLKGYDDLKPTLRKEMKRQENRLLKVLTQEFDLLKLSKTP